ncbi:hypothetical protein ACFQZS_13835 [Mucilaginibacter calamicampi]|uniref:Uncharacterized protein n=1 Tax=Mucilaginibacter calamicampi TaxID=1302352 RepID=A0ABW2Z0I9_9SPHI
MSIEPSALSNFDNAVEGQTRRDFIKIIGLGSVALPLTGFAMKDYPPVAIVSLSTDAVASVSAPVQWAVGELTTALKVYGVTVKTYDSLSKAPAGCFYIAIASTITGTALIKAAGASINIPAKREAVGLVTTKHSKGLITVAAGNDERGLIYALLELADRVRHGNDAIAALQVSKAIVEQPANRVRSLNRIFVSDVEDKPWYNDRAMWPQYLSMLATQRFNRFNLGMGIGYDFLQNVTDAYFLFAYPFLLSVPGYNVHVPELPNAERDNNLAMLKFISEQTAMRGMEFYLGIWMHGYEWLNTTNANYNIKGIDKNNHGAYCRDALRLLLQQCPHISGITFRVHGESGVNEGSYTFWETVFDGIKTCGRPVQIDMHAKGIDDGMINTALKVGVPVSISPKYWAEHNGMPYHQADIRSLEIPKENTRSSALMNLSGGSRSFTRYGYGDLLKEDRKYDVLTRVWPGTQRILLWGDPQAAAAQSRIFSFCGSAGAELMEPLSFKGRRGSGVAGDRCGYADASLKPRWDWQKYEYSLAVFGRTLYNPDTDAVWNRYLVKNFGAGAATDAGLSLAAASRILPAFLTAHGASAANNIYWPEMYTNMPITTDKIKSHYTDTPTPRVFGNVTPFDPQLFLGVNEYVKQLLAGNSNGKYTPIEVAQWIADHAGEAESHLQQMKLKAKNKTRPEYRRMEIDINMQIMLGKFFAEKLRAGCLFAIYEQAKDRAALEKALQLYKQARSHWAGAANLAKGVYKSDVAVGEEKHQQGHWLDRLPAIDADIAEMEKLLATAQASTVATPPLVLTAVNTCLQKPLRINPEVKHAPVKTFKAGQDITLELNMANIPSKAILHYRHVNHGERYQQVEMKAVNKTLSAVIPASYSKSDYPIAYYFELKQDAAAAILYPGFGAKLTDEPYFVMRQG